MLEMNTNDISKKLTGKAQEYFNDVANRKILGAMNSIRTIFNMYIDIAEKGSAEDDTKFLVTATAELFKKTRGESSAAISNAINLLFSKMCGQGDYCERLLNTTKELLKEMDRANEIIAKYAGDIIEAESSIMLFDYSSTVGTLARHLKEKGTVINCVIPESRAIDGGRPFVKKFSDYGHKVQMVPDAAIFKHIQECDMAFIGAETILPDGSTYNTIGSDLTAVLCRVLEKPFYVMSSMIKVDERGFDNYEKPLILKDFSSMFAIPGSMSYELIKVEPEDITAIITEYGVIPVNDFFMECRNYFEEMKMS